MTKHIILIFFMLCSWQARANVQPLIGDTVRHILSYEVTEMQQPLQPSYIDGVVLPISWTGNWFVSATGGATAFLGTPVGCEDLFGRVKPSYSLAVGKWFTPSVGMRFGYSGLRFKDGALSTQNYHHIHADLLWNALGHRYARQGQLRWSLVPFVGFGLLRNATNGYSPFAVSYGLQGEYRVSKRVGIMLELSNATTFQDFDGYGKPNRLGDHLLSLAAGFTFRFGKLGWRRAVDVASYMHQNERLIGYVNNLLEENRRYASRHDRDQRVLAELKKILEIEGLLGTYSHLFQEDGDDKSKHPMNNYSGLNSLRARLKHRHWDGKPSLDTTGIYAGREELVSGGVDSDNMETKSQRVWTVDTIPSVYVNGDCIGAPIYFFFGLNTAQLTETSQMLNIDELARVAKKYNLWIRVTGAADSATGTSGINQSLSMSRADFIVAELERRGISPERIFKAVRGGIADYTPIEANRHTRVELFFAE